MKYWLGVALYLVCALNIYALDVEVSADEYIYAEPFKTEPLTISKNGKKIVLDRISDLFSDKDEVVLEVNGYQYYKYRDENFSPQEVEGFRKVLHDALKASSSASVVYSDKHNQYLDYVKWYPITIKNPFDPENIITFWVNKNTKNRYLPKPQKLDPVYNTVTDIVHGRRSVDKEVLAPPKKERNLEGFHKEEEIKKALLEIQDKIKKAEPGEALWKRIRSYYEDKEGFIPKKDKRFYIPFADEMSKHDVKIAATKGIEYTDWFTNLDIKRRRNVLFFLRSDEERRNSSLRTARFKDYYKVLSILSSMDSDKRSQIGLVWTAFGEALNMHKGALYKKDGLTRRSNMAAVMKVIQNRKNFYQIEEDRGDIDEYNVVVQPGEFSTWKKDNVNFPKMIMGIEGQNDKADEIGYQAAVQSLVDLEDAEFNYDHDFGEDPNGFNDVYHFDVVKTNMYLDENKKIIVEILMPPWARDNQDKNVEQLNVTINDGSRKVKTKLFYQNIDLLKAGRIYLNRTPGYAQHQFYKGIALDNYEEMDFEVSVY